MVFFASRNCFKHQTLSWTSFTNQVELEILNNLKQLREARKIMKPLGKFNGFWNHTSVPNFVPLKSDAK